MRLKELDVIRGLSAILVILYHYTYRYYQLYPTENSHLFSFAFGHYGVQSFFIVSGFVIFMTLEKTEKSLDFIVHRFIRLFPTYWISVFITFFIVSIFSLPGRETTIYELFANLTMIHTQFGIQSVDGVYWTLLFELKFYFLMLVLFFFKLLHKIEIISIVMLLGVLIVKLLSIEHNIFYQVMNQLFILVYISYFISGIMFYKIYQKEANKLTYLTLVFAFVISLLTNRFDDSIPIIVIYLIFVLLSLHQLKILSTKPLVFLGTISYVLYLVHQNIGYIILNHTQEYHYPMWIGIVLAIITSIVLATAITLIFEKRVIKYLKNLYHTHKVKRF